MNDIGLKHYVSGGMARLERVFAKAEGMTFDESRSFKGMLLAVLANYVPDEAWDYVLGEVYPQYERCDECNHLVIQHKKDGCEVERGDGYRAGSDVLEALGPCSCQAVTTEAA